MAEKTRKMLGFQKAAAWLFFRIDLSFKLVYGQVIIAIKNYAMRLSNLGADLTMTSDTNLISRLTAGYKIALAVIGLLAICGHLILDHVITRQQDAATIINVAGRQRMLSQRIALLAEDYAHGDLTARAKLEDAADLMERSHRALTQGNDLGITNPLSAEAHELYFNDANALDKLVPAYIGNARAVLAASSENAIAVEVESLHRQALGPLLPKLDHAVTQFERESRERIRWLRGVESIVVAILLLTLVLEAMFIFRPFVRRIGLYAMRLYELATRDSLTGLLNRQFFMEAAEREVLLARRNQQPLSILAVDIDHFKSVNDTRGHAVGDEVLKRFAGILLRTIRRTDLIGRIGGEEFTIVLPKTTLDSAATIADKVRLVIEADSCAALPQVTISVGVTALADSDKTFDEAARRADAALYAAKNSGRNRVDIHAAASDAAANFA